MNHLGKALCIEFGVVALDSLMPWSKSVLAEIRLKPKAARMADDPIINIDPRPSATMRNSRNLSEFSQPKQETPRGLSFYALVSTLTLLMCS